MGWQVRRYLLPLSNVLTRLDSTPRLLIDCDNVVVGVLAGRPRDTSWDIAVQEAAELLVETRRRCSMDGHCHIHRRGTYAAVHVGISMGGGQTRPSNLHSDPDKQPVVDELLADRRIQRILNFANQAFEVYAPNLHRYYKDNLDHICQSDPSLQRNSPQNSFAAATFNLGPHTVTRPHLDYLNLPWGWCAITALGTFDHTKGGQIVLWNIKKVIEFPSTATIFIPSAVFEHFNLNVQPGEQRLSITQYTAGALFRWVESGCCLLRHLDGAARANLENTGHLRWENGVAMLSTLDMLIR
ncbi:hypothetical protein C8Q70DRAFT_915667 [Cubamyces menziesii]|nr:hypothetical protein C8Q70DRAFT_915667 [Cubamyces menziesii]